MAQTKRKRQTKHRGNAAGVVESRGRTGRKPTAEEKRGELAKAKAKRIDRRDRPPTWTGAFYRAAIAAILMLVVSIVLIKNAPIALFPVVLLIYWPLSYYTDVWMFKRRMRGQAKSGGKPDGKAAGGRMAR
jgi:hypothetical protein